MAALSNIQTPSNDVVSTIIDPQALPPRPVAESNDAGATRHAYPRKNVLAILDAHAQQHPLNRALVMAGGGRAGSANYVELAGRVRRLSRALSDRFPRAGARIAILSESCPAWGIMALATLASEHALVPLDTAMEPESLEAALRRLQPQMVVCSRNHARIAGERIARAAPNAEVVHIDPSLADVSLPPAPRCSAEPGTGTAHAAIIAFTSGTTAAPKAVEISFDNLLFEIHALTACFALRPSDRLLALLPMHHMLELTAGFLCPLWAGAEIHYLSSLVPDDALERIRAQGLTRMVTVPAWLGLLKKTLELDARGHGTLGMPASTLRAHARRALGPDFEHFVCGGAPLGDAIADFFETAGVDVVQGYGLTETSPVVATNTRTGVRRGSVGRPLCGTETTIAANGEILVRGPHVAGTYRLDDGASEALTDSAGWFHTGDLGHLDADGFLYVTGRIKSTIVLANGKNVQPEEIERRLEACEGLAESGVVAVDGAMRGDEICLVAVPAQAIEGVDCDSIENRKPALEARIRDLLTSLAPYKRPRHIVLHDRPLPRTAAGKLLRAELARWASEAIRA